MALSQKGYGKKPLQKQSRYRESKDDQSEKRDLVAQGGRKEGWRGEMLPASQTGKLELQAENSVMSNGGRPAAQGKNLTTLIQKEEKEGEPRKGQNDERRKGRNLRMLLLRGGRQPLQGGREHILTGRRHREVSGKSVGAIRIRPSATCKDGREEKPIQPFGGGGEVRQKASEKREKEQSLYRKETTRMSTVLYLGEVWGRTAPMSG